MRRIASALALALLCGPAGHAAGLPSLPDLQEGAYRGGALILAPGQARVNHLLPGMILPVRLSSLEPFLPPRQSVRSRGGDLDPATLAMLLKARHTGASYRDRKGSVRYGALRILAAGPGHLDLEATFFGADGLPGKARVLSLDAGQTADLDGDGRPDVELLPGVRPILFEGRPVDFSRLAFINDDRETSLFNLAPSAFPDGRYPSGIAGLTPSGGLLLQTDSLPGASGIQASSDADGLELSREDGTDVDLPVQMQPGDYLLHTRNGSLRRIEGAYRSGGRARFSFSPQASPSLLADVYGALSLHVGGHVHDLQTRYGVRREPPVLGARKGTQPTLESPLSATFNLVDIDDARTLMDSAYGKLVLESRALAAVTLNANVEARWGDVRADWGVELDLTQSEKLSYTLTRAYTRTWTYPVADPQVWFAVSGVPICLSMPVSLGCELTARATGNAQFGYEYKGVYGYSQWAEVTWGLFWMHSQVGVPVTLNQSSFQVLPDSGASVTGSVEARPFLQLNPGVSVAGILGASFQAQGYLDGKATGSVSVDTTGHGTYGCGLELDAGVNGSLAFSLGFWPVEKSWNLGQIFDYRKVLWQKSWNGTY